MSVSSKYTQTATQFATQATKPKVDGGCALNRHISQSDLAMLIAMMEVDVPTLKEFLICPNWRLSVEASEMAGFHYIIAGTGKIVTDCGSSIPVAPHTLVITPPKRSFRIETVQERSALSLACLERLRSHSINLFRSPQKITAGDSEPVMVIVSGYFRAVYSSSIDVFANLTSPIREEFEAGDQLEFRLKLALNEISAGQIGMETVIGGLLKQVLIALLRRSLGSAELWSQRFTMLSDPQVARAFSQMAAHPGGAHSVTSLSEIAGLSRSAFMARFTSAVGCPPMMALRYLRMHRAEILLAANILSIDQIAHAVGYADHRSFQRAIRKTYGRFDGYIGKRQLRQLEGSTGYEPMIWRF